MHPKDEEVYPVGTEVLNTRDGKNEKAVIVGHTFLKDRKNFLNYLAHIEGKKGDFALYHDDLKVIKLPEPFKSS